MHRPKDENYRKRAPHESDTKPVDGSAVEELCDFLWDPRDEANLTKVHHRAENGANEMAWIVRCAVGLTAIFIGLANHSSSFL